MNYVRSISGSVSKTWNSINPATLSGAIDVIVVEHADGSLSCSPFHVRFGKFSLLRPYEKKVEFCVNDVRQDYAMKLGEGGEAFFVFETTAHVPEGLQTSPLVSPTTSPQTRPSSSSGDTLTADLESFDLDSTGQVDQPSKQTLNSSGVPLLSPDRRTHSDQGTLPLSTSLPGDAGFPSLSEGLPRSNEAPAERPRSSRAALPAAEPNETQERSNKSNSPPMLPKHEALSRAMNLSKRLQSSNIPSHINEEGDLMLDITGYKSTEEESLRAEVVARQILSEELVGNYDIGSLIGADEKGNLWIYSSEEAKEAATRRAVFSGIDPLANASADAISDPGYHSGDDAQSQKSLDPETNRARSESDSAIGLSTPPDSPDARAAAEQTRSYAKTLRLTSDQLRGLNLTPGANPMSFSVNRATCQANMYLWIHDTPIVVSDVDGTITKSDALGHVLNMFGRDWTHLGVAKLYCDIVANGYNILYLTSRSVGQADTTRTYLNGIIQEGYKLPRGPVIMSPDRTIAALRREIYLRKPEVFKMACLRDIMSLFSARKSPFYAGFGNRLTDALSYRSVNIPSTRIFTINSNAEVSLDLLSLNKYKTGYTSMRETVDHFFPPVGMLVQEGGEEYTDFNYWRDNPLDYNDAFSLTDSESGDSRGYKNDDGDGASFDEYDDENYDDNGLRRERTSSLRSEDEGDDEMFSEDLGESYLSRESIDDTLGSSAFRPSVDSERGEKERHHLVRVNTSEQQLVSIDDAMDGGVSEDVDALDLITEATGRVGGEKFANGGGGDSKKHEEGLNGLI